MAEVSSEKRKQHVRLSSMKRFSVYLTEAFMFMKEFEWLSNSYVAEFFTQNLWLQLPQKWRECLEETTLEDVANNVLKSESNKVFRSVWPLSLLSFIAASHSLSVDRKQRRYCRKSVIQEPELSMIFKKHIKPKKRHELCILPEIINTVCQKTKTNNVVDVGSGLGHLSRMLAYQYGLDVTAVEMAGERLPVAERQIEEELKRLNEKEDRVKQYGEVTHIARWIEPDISTDDFITLVHGEGANQTKVDNEQISSEEKRCVLVGLHTCGDLASTMLKVFKNTPVITGIVSVSCCYFKMSLKGDTNHIRDCRCKANFTLDCFYQRLQQLALKNCIEVGCVNDKSDEDQSVRTHKLIVGYEDKYTKSISDGPVDNCNFICQNHNCTCHHIENINCNQDFGFPLSKYLKQFPYQPLQYKSFETACHFVDDYTKKLLDHSPNLKLHCYRAVMEVFIRHVDPKLILAPVRCKKIKNAASMSFEEYAAKVFERLDKTFNPALLQEINYEYLLSQWKNVTIYHSLVMLLGPVVESIALIDKAMYLLEDVFRNVKTFVEKCQNFIGTMGLIDNIKDFLNFDQQERLGPKELPRQVEEDLKKRRKKEDPRKEYTPFIQIPPLVEIPEARNHDMGTEFDRMFQEFDTVFKNFFGSQPSTGIYFDQTVPLEGYDKEHKEKTLREKMLDGDQSKTMEIQPFHHDEFQDMNRSVFGFHPFSMFREFFNPRFGSRTYDQDDTPQEDHDLDDDFGKGDHSLDDIFDERKDSPSHKEFGFDSDDFIPKYGGEMSSAFKYSTVRKKVNSDGSIETHSSRRDSDGNEEVVVTRSLGEQTHSIITKKNVKGEEEKTESFINMEQEELNKFEEKWNQKNKNDLHDQMLVPHVNKNWNDYFSSWWKPKL